MGQNGFERQFHLIVVLNGRNANQAVRAGKTICQPGTRSKRRYSISSSTNASKSRLLRSGVMGSPYEADVKCASRKDIAGADREQQAQGATVRHVALSAGEVKAASAKPDRSPWPISKAEGCPGKVVRHGSLTAFPGSRLPSPGRRRHNIELSCAAESQARSEPQQRHSLETADHLRRQLQRFVTWTFLQRSPS